MSTNINEVSFTETDSAIVVRLIVAVQGMSAIETTQFQFKEAGVMVRYTLNGTYTSFIPYTNIERIDQVAAV